MDNITHSLAGLLVAESAIQLRARRRVAEPARPDSAEESARFRTVAWVASMLAANLPDADLLYTGTGDPIRYMLHHRGYTHTVVLALVGAALLWGAALSVLRRRRRSGGERPPPATPEATRADARWLFGILLVSTLSHL